MSFDIMTHRQMTGLSHSDVAKKVVYHMLDQIIEDPTLGYLCGVGSQAWSLLTEAQSILHDVPLEKVRENCIPKRAEDPRKTYAETPKNSVNGFGEGEAESSLRETLFEEDQWAEYLELQSRVKALCESFASKECATAPHLASSAQHLDAIQIQLERMTEP